MFEPVDESLLSRMAELARTPLQSLDHTWRPLTQQLVAIEPTARPGTAPEGMVEIPAGDVDFSGGGVEVEGQTWAGLDVQYPWEDSPRRSHRRRMAMPRFFMDRTPVTNAQFHAFVRAAGYQPADAHNFLRQWVKGAPLAGWAHKPVTWVVIEDALAYAAWAGKRLPHDWEWQ